MPSSREIERLRKSPREIQDIANRLLREPEDQWSPYERKFLNDIAVEWAPRAARDRRWHISTRQVEYLLELRDGLEEVAVTPNGFSVARLIEECWLCRLELIDEEHIEFIERIRGRTKLKARQLGLLLHIARKLHVIEEYV
jgi:hypothetical protein